MHENAFHGPREVKQNWCQSIKDGFWEMAGNKEEVVGRSHNGQLYKLSPTYVMSSNYDPSSRNTFSLASMSYSSNFPPTDWTLLSSFSHFCLLYNLYMTSFSHLCISQDSVLEPLFKLYTFSLGDLVYLQGFHYASVQMMYTFEP